MRLPTVRGANLARQNMEFPADFAGDLNLVFIAFQRWHQDVVDTWVPLAETLRREYPQLQYYEFPTIYKMNWLSRTFLNEGMRAGIPNPATRARTITLYLDKEKFRRALEIPDESDTWVYLFDREGDVLWRTNGRYTPESGAALQDMVARHAAAPIPEQSIPV